MIFPSIEQLTKETYNRYELVIATAKIARLITDELKAKKDEMDKIAGLKEPVATDKMGQVPREIKDFPEEKPVKSAIQKIFEEEYMIVVE